MEHLLFHWEDIVDVLIDELIEEEVQERNVIEERQNNQDPSSTFQRIEDYEYPIEDQATRKQQVDLRDIMRVFDDYKRTEMSIINRL